MDSLTSTAHPTELDLLMRVVDPMFDCCWSWNHTFDTTKALHKLQKRADFSASKSVASTSTTLSSQTELTMQQKVAILEKNLRRVRKEFPDAFFDDMASAMVLNDNLYPGFKDCDFIARFLYRENDAYKGLLSPEDILRVSLAKVFKHAFFSLAKFLVEDPRGPEGMKFLILPIRVQNATYDICRKRFCNLVVEEVSLVSYALVRLAKELKKTRPRAEEPTEVTQEHEMEEPAVAIVAPLTTENLHCLDAETQTVADTDIPEEEEAESEPDETEAEVQAEPETEAKAEAEAEAEAEVPVEAPVEAEAPVKIKAEVQAEPETKSKADVKTEHSSESVDFPTPLGLAFSGLWSNPIWSGGVMMAPTIPRTRSLAPSLKSYHLVSDDDSD